MSQLILAVDRAFTPDRWVDAPTALSLYARGAVSNTFGSTAMVLRGGVNAVTGKQSILEIGSIIVVDTKNWMVKDFNYAPMERELLFQRDRYVCAYCGQLFRRQELTQDHVVPVCQGGQSTWTNLVTADYVCNQRKAGRTPEQAGMELIYVPYRPTRFEWLILKNRNILQDQTEFLSQRIPKSSRFWKH